MTRKTGAAFMGLIAVFSFSLRPEVPPAPAASGDAVEAAVAFAEEELAQTRREGAGD